MLMIFVHIAWRLDTTVSTDIYVNIVPQSQEVEEPKKSIPNDFENLSEELMEKDELSTNSTIIERSTLPRTSAIPYNILHPGERYMMYSSSGGYNNQLYNLAIALKIASKHNRTLIIPMAMRHTDGWLFHERLRQIDGLPMDHCIDFQRLERKGNILPLDIPILKFAVEYLRLNTTTWESNKKLLLVNLNQDKTKNQKFPSDKYIGNQLSSKKQVVWLRKMFYIYTHQSQFRFGGVIEDLMDLGHIQPAPYLHFLGENIIKLAFQSGSFNAMHIRLGDFVLQDRSGKDASKYLAVGLRRNWRRNKTLYIASEPGAELYFAPLKVYFRNVMRARDLIKFDAVKVLLGELSLSLPSSHIRVDVFGIIEAVICSLANDFVGTAVSTFSRTIVRLRRFRKEETPSVNVGILSYSKAGPNDFNRIKNAGIRYERTDIGNIKISNGKDQNMPEAFILNV